MAEGIITIKNLNKTYKGGVQALKDINLDIKRGDIFALLGPNGAGKTTLISIIAGLAKKSSGEVLVDGKDVEKDYRYTRAKIGLVQQEINSDFFFTVEEVVKMQAGYFGLKNIDDRVEDILKKLHLWEKRKSNGRQLSGGMKRRVMIAKALVHDPEILFLDEPTAGVDTELRENLWSLIESFRKESKTIFLTTHYLEEAERMADWVSIINEGEILFVERKDELMKRHGTGLREIYLNSLHEKTIVEAGA